MDIQKLIEEEMRKILKEAEGDLKGSINNPLTYEEFRRMNASQKLKLALGVAERGDPNLKGVPRIFYDKDGKSFKAFINKRTGEIVRTDVFVGNDKWEATGTSVKGNYVTCSDPKLVVIYQQWLKYVKAPQANLDPSKLGLEIDGKYGPVTIGVTRAIFNKLVKDRGGKAQELINSPNIICQYVLDNIVYDKNELGILQNALKKVGQKLGVISTTSRPDYSGKKFLKKSGGSTTKEPVPPTDQPAPAAAPTQQTGTVGGPGDVNVFAFKDMETFNDWAAKQKPENLANKTFATKASKDENYIIKYGPDGKPIGEPQKVKTSSLEESKLIRKMIIQEVYKTLRK